MDYVFDDPGHVVVSNFIPEESYVTFSAKYSAHLTTANIRIFFLNAGKFKKMLKGNSKQKVQAKFGTLELSLVNTHNPANREVTLLKDDLTLHRVSGFLARKALHLFRTMTFDQQEVFKDEIIMPLAEKAGVTWLNAPCAEMYLGFAPGTEFFLKDFVFYPLAIGIARVKKGLMSPDFLSKTLRQRYGGIAPADWMTVQKSLVKVAVDNVDKFPLMKATAQPHIEQFLLELGLSRTSILSMKR
ncbi:nucleocapsid protein [Lukuni virus]|uniref:Nucleoprotein n=1 Tax=Lukuni virus TaxID=1678227 RepID=A0A0R7FK62_9VIRU|nr:nucleocapsid protein [Lukuni virus]AKO90192.1 nucleocapsid protein [Lukuni virus]